MNPKDNFQSNAELLICSFINRLTGTWVASINSQAVSSAAKANN